MRHWFVGRHLVKYLQVVEVVRFLLHNGEKVLWAFIDSNWYLNMYFETELGMACEDVKWIVDVCAAEVG